MAKRKKRAYNKRVEEKETSPVIGYSLSVILFLAAIFIGIGSMNTGGVLPKDLFKAGYYMFGWAAFLLFITFFYFAILKFKNEDHKIPRVNFISMFLFYFFLSSFFFVSLATKDSSGNYLNTHGGVVGKMIGSNVLGAVDSLPSSILFFLASLLVFFFAFGISPSNILGIRRFFNKDEDDESELESLKSKASPQQDFKLNEGVPVEYHGKNSEKSNFSASRAAKVAAAKINSKEQEALTAPSDPDWKFPSVTLLNQTQNKADAGDINANAKIIHDTFFNFKIDVGMERVNIGPRVTQYQIKPPADVKLTKITALENNLALDLAAHSIRIEAPIPGQRAVGIEVPNVKPAIVRLSSILTSSEWTDNKGNLSFVVGKDIAGNPIVGNLAKMPHLLIAGQTGSGKSVMINTLLTSLLYGNSPADLKLILVDPKQVEMGQYADIPHLIAPVINEPEKCISALKWAVEEMNRRLKTMAGAGKRNIDEYNLDKANEGMPFIVIVIDELADLMMMAARDVESLIVRLAQKSRAAGIHLVLATQRPSVDVITGLIKANVPARVAFTVASQVDSRTIIDQNGAEKLLGEGDMLLLTSDMAKPKRVQAAFIENAETVKVNDFLRAQRPPTYDEDVISQPVHIGGKHVSGGEVIGSAEADDTLWKDAVQVVIDNKKASTSLLQRRLRIGYGRAARLIETMEEQGIVGMAEGSRPREVLVTAMDEVFGHPETEDSEEEIVEEDTKDKYLNQ